MQQAPNEFQLRTQGERILERHPHARLLAFFCPLPYQGAGQVMLKGQPFQVQVAQSSLHLHRLAAQCEQHQQHILVLCPQRDWLSQDLRDRLPERELREIDPWESLRSLFGAEGIDSALQRSRNLAQWLLECDTNQFPKAPGGILTRELAWETLLYQRLGLTNECYDPLQLLLTLTRLEERRSVEPELAAKAREWLVQRGGGALVDHLLEVTFRLGAGSALALSLVCEVIFLAPSGPESLMAQGSLDRFFQGRRLPSLVGQELGNAFRNLLPLVNDWAWLGPVQMRAREILSELSAAGLARHSLILPEGWDELVAQGATDLSSRPDFRQHFLYPERRDSLEPLLMAQRLHRFLAAPTPLPKGALAGWMDDYLDNVAWVDRARQWLQHPTAQTQQAFSDLSQRALNWREPYSAGFAQALVRGHADTLPVEGFLSQVLTPLVQNGRVLVLVLDGCSQAALLDLLDSLDERNWSHYTPNQPSQRRLLSALPSVTEVARTSLLCGQLTRGAAPQELAQFAAHSELRAACRKDYPPQLFHKKDEEKALKRTASPDYKLVAVVINSIDDTLAKEEQLNLHWTTDLIGPLVPLLEAARALQRAVLIVSDHGHVLDQGTAEWPSSGGAGNRWQPGETAEEGAVIVSGGRLQMASAARLLHTEKVRYGPRKRGYHGGASPQEMTCALALLAQPGQTIPGWTEGSRRPPEWWNEPGSGIHLQAGGGQGQLFETVMSERLFASPAMAGREGRPPHLDRAIDLLAERGKMERDALAQALGQSRSQLQTLLPVWTRWLNVAGKVALRADHQSVWLDEAAVRSLLG